MYISQNVDFEFDELDLTTNINQSAAVLGGVRAKGSEIFTDTNELLGFLEELDMRVKN